jgi:protocatechuate 3,4-dioxygenase beta subunit
MERDKREISRRLLLKSLAGGLCLLGGQKPWEVLAAMCKETPPQTEGPFYPVQDQAEKDNDLTRVKGSSGRAKGKVLYILGRITDEQCRPVSGALVEIWQAGANGRYNHPEDSNDAGPLDQNFQYWGYHRTDHEGHYRFTTIVPPPYPAGPFWTRPSHVHFKVHRREAPILTTQMYFAGDRYLESDLIFTRIPREEREPVVVELRKAGPDYEPDAKLCRFDIALRSSTG